MKINLRFLIMLLFCILIFAEASLIMIFYDFRQPTIVTDRVHPRDEIKVMLLLNGKPDWGTWSGAHFQGFTEAVDSIDIEGAVHADISPEQCYPLIDDFAAAGGKLVIAPSVTYTECINKKAEQYHDLHFVGVIDSGLRKSSNIMGFFAKMYIVRYLTGIAAAYASSSDDFGYVISSRIPETVRGVNAFTIGVRTIRPNAKVHVAVSGKWNDTERDLQISRMMLAAYPDIRVMSYHLDSIGVDRFCADNGLFCIGYHTTKDQYFRKSNLISAFWDWKGFYKSIIAKDNNGIFKSGSFWLDFRQGSAVLSKPELDMLPEEAIKIINRASRDFYDGYDPIFDGPIYDAQGKMRFPAGKKPDNTYLLNKMDWFVMGVDLMDYER